MIKVYQTKTVKNDGYGDCFNACIASILELPLRQVADIFPNTEGCWISRWKVWLADKGYKLGMRSPLDPPKGYSIATVYTERKYPDDHPTKAGILIAHSCVAFDGEIVHDPYPLHTETRKIKYYTELKPLCSFEKEKHLTKFSQGTCNHGYRVDCAECMDSELV